MRFVTLAEARTRYFQTPRPRRIGKCKGSVCLHLEGLWRGSLSLSVASQEERTSQGWPLTFGSLLLSRTMFMYHSPLLHCSRKNELLFLPRK